MVLSQHSFGDWGKQRTTSVRIAGSPACIRIGFLPHLNPGRYHYTDLFCVIQSVFQKLHWE